VCSPQVSLQHSCSLAVLRTGGRQLRRLISRTFPPEMARRSLPARNPTSEIVRPVRDSPEGHVRAHVRADAHDKIRRAIGKERRVLSSRPHLINRKMMQTTRLPQSKTVGSREGNRAEPIDIWKARNLIHNHSDEELSLTRVATAVKISGNHLSEKFKRVTGVNFVEYIARTRFEKALGLLHDRNLRVSEIAFAVGFQSLSQFNRVFRRFSGKSPTEYRVGARQAELARAKLKRRR
jgi:AraC-like DNA-binding protein